MRDKLVRTNGPCHLALLALGWWSVGERTGGWTWMRTYTYAGGRK